MSNESKGVIYIASGNKFIEEACNSAASLKNYLPEIPITLFADQECSSPILKTLLLLLN